MELTVRPGFEVPLTATTTIRPLPVPASVTELLDVVEVTSNDVNPTN
jgi:hypothetical protein